ncbi:MAG: RimK family alpha-L-glutamate ligase [Spirochaetae bacterium HGW-Spirochaetae-1]|jgi:glutathione synthase/RimK-type ligase-like ATP-grasp enzyme|nr:MAG: RimK family alpha-L-glutamate ligase [Spirochaetae bacterium HGW-Spirochaetae-1]
MANYIVVNSRKSWQFNIPGAEVIEAREYFFNEQFVKMKDAKIFNLCKSYRYQATGYYVSLLATARGHRAFPDINTIQDMKAPIVVRLLAEDMESLIQRSFSHIQSDKFVLSIYFGKNVSKRYDKLSMSLYNVFQAPFLRVFFSQKNKKWKIQNIQVISINDIPEDHHSYIVDFATLYFSRRITHRKRKMPDPYDMAILVGPGEETAPSDEKALERFVWAADKVGFDVELIDKDTIHRIAEFDALFIREQTSVNHHTFRFSQRAWAEGIVVIDDPDSIIKCTNKVYLSEMLNHYHIPSPHTIVLNRESVDKVPAQMDFPVILKQPDSAYSQGVMKVNSPEEYYRTAGVLLEKSDLIIAQEYMRTDYDWRVGIINRKPLYVSKYFMAANHWQIVNWATDGKERHGMGETMAVEDAPRQVVETALRAANYIGDSLYGVDLKVVNNKCYVIEINDNPSIDFGIEDAVLKDELYMRIMQVFMKRVQSMKDRSWE